MAVESEDVLYAVLAHDSYVNGISRRQIRVADNDVPSTFDNFEVYRQHVIDSLPQNQDQLPIAERLDQIGDPVRW